MTTSNHPSAATTMKSFSAILMIGVLGVFQHGTCSVHMKRCILKSTCSCVNVDGLIDLHPLGNNDGTPRFRDITDPDGKTFYFWNPCYGFNEAGCHDVAMCQIKDSGATSQSLGNQSSLKSVSSSRFGQVFQYINWGGANFSGNVILTCDAGEEGVVTRRPDADSSFLSEFYLELRSKYACPIKVNGSTTVSPTESTTRHRRPTTPAFIRPAITPSKPSSTPLLDLNTLSTLTICLMVFMVLLIALVLIMFCCLYRRLNALVGLGSSHKLSSVIVNGDYKTCG